MDIERKVLEFVRRHKLIVTGDRVLAGLSAGPDSTFMVIVLNKIKDKIGFELAAAYFDHGIRETAEIEAEKKLSRELAENLGISFFAGSGDVPGEKERMGVGIEEAARMMRLAYLEDQAKRWGATKIALGHTEDDQVETILHHIIRGTGLKGLAGIPIARDEYIRPIICCRRSEITAYLTGENIAYSTDRTNRDNSIMRNRIRNVLLPLLREEFNPNIDDSLLRLRENSIEALHFADKKLECITREVGKDGSLVFRVEELKGLTGFEIYLLVDSVLRGHFSIFQDIERTHLDSAKRLITELSSGKRVQFPFGIEILKEHDLIVIRKRKGDETLFPREVSITGPGRFNLEPWGLTLSIEKIPAGSASKVNPDSACFSSISFPIRVRTRKAGDRMKPLGLNGSKKISDIFIDKKVGLSQRDGIPIFEDGKGIFWIPGVAVDGRAKIDKDTEEVIKLTLYATKD